MKINASSFIDAILHHTVCTIVTYFYFEIFIPQYHEFYFNAIVDTSLLSLKQD